MTTMTERGRFKVPGVPCDVRLDDVEDFASCVWCAGVLKHPAWDTPGTALELVGEQVIAFVGGGGNGHLCCVRSEGPRTSPRFAAAVATHSAGAPRYEAPAGFLTFDRIARRYNLTPSLFGVAALNNVFKVVAVRTSRGSGPAHPYARPVTASRVEHDIAELRALVAAVRIGGAL